MNLKQLFLPFCLLLTLGVQAKFQGEEKLDNNPELAMKFREGKYMETLHEDLIVWCDEQLKDYTTQEEQEEAITTYFEEQMKEGLVDAVEEVKQDLFISNPIVRFIFDYQLFLLFALLAGVVVVEYYLQPLQTWGPKFYTKYPKLSIAAAVATVCFGIPMLTWLYAIKIYPTQRRSKRYHKYVTLSYSIDQLDHPLLRFHCEVLAPKYYALTPKNREKFMRFIQYTYRLVGTSGAWKDYIEEVGKLLEEVMPAERISFDDLAIEKANEKAKSLAARYVEGEEILRKLQYLLVFLETTVKTAEQRNLHPADFALGHKVIVLVHGKWGTGKTHLIQQFLQELGINVVSGDLSQGDMITQIGNVNKGGSPSAIIWDDGDRYWNNKSEGILASDLAILDPKSFYITDPKHGLEYHLPLVTVVIANYEIDDPAMRDRFTIVISTEKGFTDEGGSEICVDYMHALIKAQQAVGNDISLKDLSEEEQMKVQNLYREDPEEKSLRPSLKFIDQLVYQRVAEKNGL